VLIPGCVEDSKDIMGLGIAVTFELGIPAGELPAGTVRAEKGALYGLMRALLL
jgi:hypothetical protein